MIPIAVQMLVAFSGGHTPLEPSNFPIIYPLLGAIFSGAVTGNHISPTSDTMIMSATSSGAYHMDHVNTQHTYSIPVYFSTALVFGIIGYLISLGVAVGWLISIVVGFVSTFVIFTVLNRVLK